MSNIVVAVTSATVFLGTQRCHVQQGSAWAADSPLVVAHPDMFSADPARALGLDLEPAGPSKSKRLDDAPVEQKTAAPGEKSNVRNLARRGR